MLRKITFVLATMLFSCLSLMAENGLRVKFVSLKEARELIVEQDDFTKNLSQFDIDSRVGKTGATLDELQQLRQESCREWTASQKDSVLRCIEIIECNLSAKGLALPPLDEILIVKTSTQEEGQAGAYTRGNTIYLGERFLESITLADSTVQKPMATAMLSNVIAHEIFHVLTRQNSRFKSMMYSTLGFSLMPDPMTLPDDVQSIHISNPDIDSHEAYAEFTINGQKRNCIMTLVTDKPYEGGSLFGYIKPVLIPLGDTFVPDVTDGKTVMVNINDVPDFNDRMGLNTGYVIDPEECLADNFYMAINGFTPTAEMPELPNPEIIEKILEVIKTSNAPLWTMVGDGTAANPYQIGTAEDLLHFAQLVNSETDRDKRMHNFNAVLTADIDLSEVCGPEKGNWTPIGSTQDKEMWYHGTIHGKGHTISNLYYHSNDTVEAVGLLGFCTYVTIDSLSLQNVDIVAPRAHYAAAVAGFCSNEFYYRTKMTHVAVSGCIEGGLYAAGFGNYALYLIDSENYATIKATNAGGLGGFTMGSTVQSCINHGTVMGSKLLGGIVSEVADDQDERYIHVYDCCNYGKLMALEGAKAEEVIAGGIVGQSLGTYNYITNVLSAGSFDIPEASLVGMVAGSLSTLYQFDQIGAIIYDATTNRSAGSTSGFVGLVGTGLNESFAKYAEFPLSSEQIHSGLAAILLNHFGENPGSWGQAIGTDDVPRPGGPKVYPVGDDVEIGCNGKFFSVASSYNNTDSGYKLRVGVHSFVDTECEYCHMVKIDGNGTQENPFQISNAKELLWYSDYVNGHTDVISNDSASAVLIADIDLAEVCGPEKGNWHPISSDGINKYNFNLHFNGQGHTISNLYYSDEDIDWMDYIDYVGLFGTLYGNSVIENLRFRNVQISGRESSRAGAVCAENHATIRNVVVESGNISCDRFAGGIAGRNDKCIEWCENHASLKGKCVAGIAGSHDEGIIQCCSNYGTISDNPEGFYDSGVGGIVGYSYRASNIYNCANYGKLIAVNNDECYVGGIKANGMNTSVVNCLSVGEMEVGIPQPYGAAGMIMGDPWFWDKSHSGMYVYNNERKYQVINYDYKVISEHEVPAWYPTGYRPSFPDCYLLPQTTDELKSGMAAVLLDYCADYVLGDTHYGGYNADKIERIVPQWGQTIGTDTAPLLNGPKVYPLDADLVINSQGEIVSAPTAYSNTDHGFKVVMKEDDPSGINGLSTEAKRNITKRLLNGNIIIEHNGKAYSVSGQELNQ